jgi:hypothetical protein
MLAGFSATQIQTSISNVAVMSGLRTLTSAEVFAISVALGGSRTPASPSPSPSVIPSPTVQPSSQPVSCAPNLIPQRSPLRFLSNQEYDNIANDVFKLTKKPSMDNAFSSPAAGASGFTNTGYTSDPSSPAITDIAAQKYWAAANQIADFVITNKGQAGSAYSVLASCAPSSGAPTDACYTTIVQNAVLQLWRRPVSTSAANNELTRLLPILKGQSTFDASFHDLLATLLMSPNFLTVAYPPSSTLGAGQAFALDHYQLASRLSFFLWQSVPDSSLFAAASAGTLKNSATLTAQVKRMLADAKALRIATLLTNEWLDVDRILDLGLSATTINASTLNDLVTETTLMFQDVITSDASFLNVLSANYSFLNQNLATYYGVSFSGATSSGFYRTSLASTSRKGVLNQAGYLIATSGSPTATHPVGRGKAVALGVGCVEIPPPPANVDTTPPANLPAGSTPRQMLAIHTSNPLCASCHSTLDAYGLALENFDSFGKWRTSYASLLGNPAIDASGTLPTGEKFKSGPEFVQTLIDSASTRSCLTRKLMAAGLARRVASSDDVCVSNQISASGMTPTAKFSDLINGIVGSPQFLKQTTESQ